jgi:hypothetical protein
MAASTIGCAIPNPWVSAVLIVMSASGDFL